MQQKQQAHLQICGNGSMCLAKQKLTCMRKYRVFLVRVGFGDSFCRTV